MTQLPTCFIDRTGLTRLAPSSTSGSGGWLLSFVPSSDWAGSVTLMKDTAAPGTVPQPPAVADLHLSDYIVDLTATPAEGGTTRVTSGLPISAARTCVVPLPSYPLWASATVTRGSMVVYVSSYDAVVTTTAANLSELVIDAVPLTYPADLAFQFQLAGTSADTLE